MPDLASQLWNADETGFCTAVASTRVVFWHHVELRQFMKQQGGVGGLYNSARWWSS